MTKHILCAIDLGHAEEEARHLRKAADLAQHYGASLSVVAVIPDYSMSIVGSYFEDGTMKKAVADTNAHLHRFVQETLPDFGHVQHIVEVGTVYEMILDAIRRSDADLVVMGAHKPNLVDRFMGPNAARVARAAPVSVLILRD